MGHLNRYVLDETIYTLLKQKGLHPRQRKLLEWLHDPNSCSTDVLGWLAGNDLTIYREEHPALAILHSLPDVQTHEVESVLADRLADAIDWMAGNPQFRAGWTIESWLELFDLVTNISQGELFKQPLAKLRRSIAKDRSAQFLGEEAAYTFTKLIRYHQPDNELEAEWIALICGEEYTGILRATLFEALRGLMLMPDMVGSYIITQCTMYFCDRVNKASQSDETRKEIFAGLQKMLKQPEYLRYNDPILRIGKSLVHEYPWLPFPNSKILAAIHVTTDLGVLSQIARQMQLGDLLDADLAKERCRKIYKENNLPQVLVNYAEKKLTRSDHSGKGLVLGLNKKPSPDNKTNGNADQAPPNISVTHILEQYGQQVCNMG